MKLVKNIFPHVIFAMKNKNPIELISGLLATPTTKTVGLGLCTGYALSIIESYHHEIFEDYFQMKTYIIGSLIGLRSNFVYAIRSDAVWFVLVGNSTALAARSLSKRKDAQKYNCIIKNINLYKCYD